MSGGRALLVALVCALSPPAFVAAQPAPASPFLFINQEQMLTGSRTGQTLLAQEEAARDTLRAEARAIDAAFEAEERALNDLRATMSAADFRAKADDFDARVIKARQDQDERSNALAQEQESGRRQFYSAVAPILVKLLGAHRAYAIFDENSVLLADESLNITAEVIAEIDAAAAQALPVPPAVPEDYPVPAPGADPGTADPAIPGPPPARQD